MTFCAVHRVRRAFAYVLLVEARRSVARRPPVSGRRRVAFGVFVFRHLGRKLHRLEPLLCKRKLFRRARGKRTRRTANGVKHLRHAICAVLRRVCLHERVKLLLLHLPRRGGRGLLHRRRWRVRRGLDRRCRRGCVCVCRWRQWRSRWRQRCCRRHGRRADKRGKRCLRGLHRLRSKLRRDLDNKCNLNHYSFLSGVVATLNKLNKLSYQVKGRCVHRKPLYLRYRCGFRRHDPVNNFVKAAR